MTQKESIVKRLKRGWTTGLDAVYDCGCLKLSTRVSELRRDGYIINSQWREVGGKKFMAYRWAK